MKSSELAQYFEKIENTSSRLEITQLLSDLFTKLSADEIAQVTYLLQGRVCPLFEKSDFQMAEKMVIKAISNAFQIDKTALETELRKIGDIGLVVEHFRKDVNSFDQNDLSVKEVYEQLRKITETSGEGSQEMKQKILASIIVQVDPLAARYIARIPTGALRLGFSDMTVLDAYSWMLTGGKSLRKQIETAYHVRPDLGFIGKTLKEKGIEGLTHVKPELFTPILMMRAERMSSGEEIMEKVGECAIEPKFDGFRLQAHYSRKKKKVILFTRGLESVAETYPDVVEGMISELDVDDIIIEGEAIGFVPETEEFLPFQETVQRKRKHGVEEKAKEIPLKLFTFDLLYLNGKSYIDEPYTVRRAQIEKVITNAQDVTKGTILAAKSEVLNSAKAIENSFEDSVTHGLEGIIAKKLDGVYQAGARGSNWIKFKRSYASSSLEDTIDCVVMGYDAGKGKRSGFGIGAFLVGVYDEKKDMFVTMAKIGTGLTDDEWREMKKRCDGIVSTDKPAIYEVDNGMSVDAWVQPEIVVEILADEITRSPIHTAGRVMKASKSGSAFDVDVPGFALRFPRLQKFRDDKRIEDATTVKEIEDIFAAAHKK